MPRSLVAAALAALVFVPTGGPVSAQSALTLTTSPNRIAGEDATSAVHFEATLVRSDVAVVDVVVRGKRVHAELDYGRKALSIHSSDAVGGAAAPLGVPDILALQALLKVLSRSVDANSLHGDALTSLLNLLSSAPPDRAIDLESRSGAAPQAESYTSICDEIGRSATATYRLGPITYTPSVTVGPVCYAPPALGRCGAGAGPDPLIGVVQRFTQQCLNHDQCCVATGNRIVGIANVCGNKGHQCLPEFNAAANGFFFAPDCGRTKGQWVDSNGYRYALKGGKASGDPSAIVGTVDTGSCGTYAISGLREGQSVTFKAADRVGGDAGCADAFAVRAAYTNCNKASGVWNDFRPGGGGDWSWKRVPNQSSARVPPPFSERSAADR